MSKIVFSILLLCIACPCLAEEFTRTLPTSAKIKQGLVVIEQRHQLSVVEGTVTSDGKSATIEASIPTEAVRIVPILFATDGSIVTQAVKGDGADTTADEAEINHLKEEIKLLNNQLDALRLQPFVAGAEAAQRIQPRAK